MTKTRSRTIHRVVPLVFYLLLIAFLVVYLKSIDYSTLGEASFHIGYLAVATVLALGFRYWGAYIWTVLLRSLGAKNVKLSRTLIYVYAKSWLGRYIPGTAPWILGKIYFAARQGISKNKLAVSSLLEGALQIIVQMIFALALLAFDPRLNIISGHMKVLIVLAAATLSLFLVPRLFNWSVAVVYKLIRKRQLDKEHYASGKTITKGFGLYVVGSIISSLSLFFIAKTVYPELGYDQIFFVMGVGTLAGAVSMLAVFAPSGIGVREGIQLVLLSLIMPTEIALVITVVTRLWSVVVDLMFYALSFMLRGKNQQTGRHVPTDDNTV